MLACRTTCLSRLLLCCLRLFLCSACVCQVPVGDVSASGVLLRGVGVCPKALPDGSARLLRGGNVYAGTFGQQVNEARETQTLLQAVTKENEIRTRRRRSNGADVTREQFGAPGGDEPRSTYKQYLSVTPFVLSVTLSTCLYYPLSHQYIHYPIIVSTRHRRERAMTTATAAISVVSSAIFFYFPRELLHGKTTDRPRIVTCRQMLLLPFQEELTNQKS